MLIRFFRLVLVLPLVTVLLVSDPSEAAGSKRRPVPSVAGQAALHYAEAVAANDRQATAQLDFNCLYRMVTGPKTGLTAFPPSTDPAYAACSDQLVEAHKTAVEYRDQGPETLWPGKGSLVFFREGLGRYPASAFVMDLLGLSPPAGGLRIELLETRPMPAGSFTLREDGPMRSAPATLVRVRVTYKDPLTAPVAHAQGAYKWTNTVKRPRQALKAVTLQWPVLTGLKKLGFPSDVAVVNLPVTPARQAEDGTIHPAVPFLTDYSGYVPDSAVRWGPEDASGVLLAAVDRAARLPEAHDRIALLNRVLIVDPRQPEALKLLTQDLYETILATASAAHHLVIADPQLSRRFNELYWDIYAQTWRMDLSLGMEMGGFTKPTPADYLYRLIPAMEQLVALRPGDLPLRMRLGTLYRWNNDQAAAIETHEKVVGEIPASQPGLKAQALIELAMSRIAKVSWNRTFDDPGIQQAYKDADQASGLTDAPLDKFTAAYTMAYSLAFMPNRDTHLMLTQLQEAHRWYKQLAGASVESWRYLLANDTLKGLIETNPDLKPLLASG